MTSTTSSDLPPDTPAAANPARTTPPARRVIDAPIRAFHWLFALSFTGAWLTAESDQWRGLHVTLGYAFGALLLFRVVYGLMGPRQARLSLLWHRVSGLGDWWRHARAGKIDLPRLATLGMGAAMLLLMAIAAPLVLAGYGAYVDGPGMEDLLEDLHEFLANSAMALVAAHLTLIVLLSLLRRRNLALPMLTGHTPGPGPDLVKANRAWLAGLLLVTFLGFVGWQTAVETRQPGGERAESSEPGRDAGQHADRRDGDHGHDHAHRGRDRDGDDD
jgi:cytochrome b